MSCKVLLDSNPKPSRAEIRTAVAGNLCRCGTYPHVIDAVEKVAGVRHGGMARAVGRSTRRRHDPRLFSDDLRVASATLEVMAEDGEEA